jgi:beta-N-acetylhexosaminidase
MYRINIRVNVLGGTMRKREKKHKKHVLVAIVIAMLLILGYAGIQHLIGSKDIANNSNQTPITQTSENSPSESSTPVQSSLPTEISPSTVTSSDSSESIDSIDAQIEKMSLEEKLGQLVIVGVDGYENDEHSRALIEKYHVGGFILFKSNIQDSKQMLALLNSLKNTNTVNKVPLFLSVDEEGGRVSRMPREFLKFPTNNEIGKLNNSDLSYQIGSIIGEELKSFGFNMNFAPVLDINSNPQNPVIGDRSFGSEEGIVTKLGIQTMKGLQNQNIISVVKHFPGHGDTSVDSHIGLPKVNNDLERLESFELLPFSAAIENNVEAIMVAHILLPKIDPNYPASFSKTIISDILRKNMNFNGVVITDDFTMGAIVKNYDIGRAAVRSIKAGSDLVLVCHDFDKQEAVIKALQNAAKSGTISSERIDQSVYRIMKLKQEYALSNKPVKSEDPQIINDKIKALFSK